ncbi:MAG: sugar ABC transporter permease [Planctomycetota bacterium]
MSATASKLGPGIAPYVFVAPFVAVFGAFMLGPLIGSIGLSMRATAGPAVSDFVFLDNFAFLLRDPDFWTALRNTFIFAAGSVFLQLPLSLALAMALNSDSIAGRAFLRLVYFAPVLVGLVFAALLFQIVFEKDTGLLNTALASFADSARGWTGLPFSFDPEFPWLTRFVLPALILAALWMYTGFNMVYFLAALQSVDRSLLEAASIDGAGPWRRFLHVTVPAIRPVGSFVVLLSIIGSMQLFELPWIMLNGGPGPDNRGLTIVMYLYQWGFQSGDLGYAAAIGWVLAVILIVFALAQRTLSGEKATS